MDVHRFNNVAVEAVSVDLIHDFLDFVLFPDLTGHFVVQSPDDGADTGDLLDVVQCDGVVALTIPTPTICIGISVSSLVVVYIAIIGLRINKAIRR